MVFIHFRLLQITIEIRNSLFFSLIKTTKKIVIMYLESICICVFSAQFGQNGIHLGTFSKI